MTKPTAFMRQLLAKAVRDRRGSITVITAGYFIVVLGAAGLGTEASYWYMKKRSMQGAADSAAFAAAAAVLSGETFTTSTTGTPVSAAKALLATYGITDGDATISVASPPTSGAYTSDDTAVEVIVTQSQPRLISALFISTDPAFVTRSVAKQVSGASGTPPSCVVTLDKTKVQPDVTTNGTANVNMAGCNVFINSDDMSGALDVSGTSTYTANATYMNGNYSTGGGATLTDSTGTFVKQGTTWPDPYAGVAMPAPGACNQGTNVHVSGGTAQTPIVLQPGTYCGGLTINAGANVYLSPGTYIIDGSAASTNGNVFMVNGSATVTGASPASTGTANDGTTIVLTGSGSNYATVQVNGGANVTLTAPGQGATSGIPGMAFYQDRNAPATPNGSNGNQFNGGATMNIKGSMYFPNQLVTFSGGAGLGSGGATCTQIVSYQLVFSGNTNFNSSAANCANSGIASLGGNGGPATISLVE
jgi:Flp pilus assembly protein TadG